MRSFFVLMHLVVSSFDSRSKTYIELLSTEAKATETEWRCAVGDGARTALEKVLRSQWHPSVHGEVSRAVSDSASVIAQGVWRAEVDV